MPPASTAADPWDDWESEDYGRGVKPSSDEASANARLWQVANNSLSFGPSLVLSGHSSTNHNPYAYDSSPSTSSPAPPAAFVPSLKILKRPSNNSGNNSLANSQAARDQQKKTLKDRERAYNEARNRIFGASTSSAPASATPSGASSPVAKAISSMASVDSPSTQEKDLAVSLENLGLDSTSKIGAGKDASRSASPAPVKLDRSSNPGRQRIPRAGGSASPSQSTPSTSRPSTPSSTIIREPINPPSSAEKNSSAKVHMQARGFSTTKKPKILSPAAITFVPGSFTVKQDKATGKKQSKKVPADVSGGSSMVA